MTRSAIKAYQVKPLGSDLFRTLRSISYASMAGSECDIQSLLRRFVPRAPVAFANESSCAVKVELQDQIRARSG